MRVDQLILRNVAQYRISSALTASGAALEYRELPDLSHTYPRSENVRILRWFEGLPRREPSAG